MATLAFVRGMAAMFATLIVASMVIFVILAVMPGDPAALLANRGGAMVNPESIEAARRELGLDQPLPVRYGTWLAQVVRGDLARSWTSGKPVRDLIWERLGPTLLLSGTILIVATAATLVLGGLGGLHPDGAIDRITRALALLGTALPAFLAGLLALRFIALGLGWGSIIGDGTVRTLALPALTGALGLTAFWVRPFRLLVVDALATDWGLACRARGASNNRLLIAHALPNALVGFLPLLALGIGGLLAGSIIIEYVFSWPGLGPFVIESIKRRDLPVVQGIALLSVTFYIVSTEIANTITRSLDPNRRPSGSGS